MINRPSACLFYLFFVMTASLVGTPALSEEDAAFTSQSTGQYGFSAALSVVPFVGGASGPTTLISETNYKDTFDTGYGGRVEIFYDWSSGWRFSLGGVYNRWKGEYFQGGEFPQGAQFDDFSAAGFYVGAKYRFNRKSDIRPYLLGNLGIVSLSSVDIVVDGNKISYWNQTYKDYMDIGAGIEYCLTKAISLYIDIRLELYGKPDSAYSFMAEATGAQTLPLAIGMDFRF